MSRYTFVAYFVPNQEIHEVCLKLCTVLSCTLMQDGTYFDVEIKSLLKRRRAVSF